MCIRDRCKTTCSILAAMLIVENPFLQTICCSPTVSERDLHSHHAVWKISTEWKNCRVGYVGSVHAVTRSMCLTAAIWSPPCYWTRRKIMKSMRRWMDIKGSFSVLGQHGKTMPVQRGCFSFFPMPVSGGPPGCLSARSAE